ncbi:FGGY family carbohydrate kinase [Marinoscillum furvescens]|uniref:Xylulokinase n=1 Tax=Marinoscillum furvescens DSM 4134 TaxID=1122208 RepID=A0A3D9LH61_MARFU|nr:FGGY family carbohydrate kinase [Marinoscillum furvescens]REE05824.1 xylulokinase [Marinoscillum furvescens DSM 4134]
MYLIGYDIGSSSIKAALVDARTHQTVKVVQYPETEMDMISRQSGWAEQQPELWWQNLCFATKKLLTSVSIDRKEIKSVGLSYQMHGLVLINEQKRPLRPAIIWCDSRAVSIGDKAFEDLGFQYCLGSCLNSPGNFTASKLKWVKDHEPEAYESAYKFLLPGDYISMQLTDNIYTTISGLSEGILWDFKSKDIAWEVLDYFELNHKLVPEVIGAFDVQGYVTREASEYTGLPEGISVTYRAGDQPNNALSLNVVNPGEMAATCGTSGVVYGVVDKPRFDEKSRVNAFAHANYTVDNERIGVLLCINGAGMQYSWMKHQVALSGRKYDDMERMSASIPIGSDGLCILPFGNGAERILENKNINSQVINLQFNRHTRAHMYRAALEGVAFSFVYGINLLKDMGLEVSTLRVGNDNMFQSEIFSTTIASLLDCSIEVVETTGAIGAAKASGVGAGIYQDLEEALGQVAPYMTFEPTLNRASCEQAYHFWLSNLEKAMTRVDVNKGTGVDQKKVFHTMKSKSVQTFLSSLQQDLESLKKHPDPAAVAQLLSRVNQQLHKERDWAKLDERVETTKDEFYKRLKQINSRLSAEDIYLCRLVMMELTSKEIAELMNLSIRGVETKRYRLRKKLKLSGDTDLESFLSGIA